MSSARVSQAWRRPAAEDFSETARSKVTVEQKDLSPCFVASSDEVRRLAALADQPLIPLAELPAAEVKGTADPETLEPA